MELTLQVNDDVARKIRGLSVLTGKSALEITNDISDHIEELVTKQIIESVGGRLPTSPNTGAALSGLALNHSLTQRDNSYDILGKMETGLSGEDTEYEDPRLIFPLDQSPEDEDDEVETAGEGLADITEDEAEEMDDELPQSFLSQNDEKEEEMTIKNKEGKEVGYDDELMADIQSMAEDFEGNDGLVNEDPALAAASYKTKASVSTVKEIPDDGANISLDVLPTDYDIEKVSGNNHGAADFFNKAFFGVEGDKSKRNQTKKKVLKGRQ